MDDPHILLVEDEQITAMDIREMIEGAGYTVEAEPGTGKSVIDALREGTFDLVMMDINLPGDRDGIELTSVINEKFNVPVVYLTAYSDGETLERARETHPAGFLVKPVTQVDLKATVEMVIGKISASE